MIEQLYHSGAMEHILCHFMRPGFFSAVALKISSMLPGEPQERYADGAILRARGGAQYRSRLCHGHTLPLGAAQA